MVVLIVSLITPAQFSFGFNEVVSCNICGEVAFIKCVWCNHTLCFRHFFEEFHYYNDTLSFISSKRTLIILNEIFQRNFNRDINDFDLFTNSSLLLSCNDKILVELTFENIHFTKRIFHNGSTTYLCELNTANLIVFEASDTNIFNDPKHIIILSKNNSLDLMLSIMFEFENKLDTIQVKRFDFHLSNINLNFDLLFNEWLQYEPEIHEQIIDKTNTSKKVSFSRRNSSLKSHNFLLESVHKSSEKDYLSLSSGISSMKNDQKFQLSLLLMMLFNSKDLFLNASIDKCLITHQTICSLTNKVESVVFNLTELKIETIKNKFHKSSTKKNEMVFTVHFKDFSIHTLHENRQFYQIQPISIFIQFFVDTYERKINFHMDISQLALNLSEFQLTALLKTAKFIRQLRNNFQNKYKIKISQICDPEVTTSEKDCLSAFEESPKDSLIESTSESCILKNLEKIQNDNNNSNNEISPKIWGQVTCTKISIKLYTIQEDTPSIIANQKFYSNAKIIFDIEDITVSCTIRDSFMRFDFKIVTIQSAHFYRINLDDKWLLGKHSGAIIQRWIDRLLELDKSPLITSTIIFAFRHDVYKKWLKESTTLKLMQIKNELLCEINVKLMPIEIIASMKMLNLIQPFIKLAQNIYRTFEVKNLKKTAWLTNKLPLLNFECQRLRIIVPIETTDSSNNTILFYFQNICIEQKISNLIQRSFIIKPDLFNKAARAGILSMPGSVLEDRQYSCTIEAIYSFSASWDDILMLIKTEHNLSDFRVMDENPAAQWHQRLTDIDGLQFFPLAQKISNVSFVIAPSMYFNEELVCGHAFELNFPSKVDFVLQLSHVNLLSDLLNEFNSFKTSRNNLVENQVDNTGKKVACNGFVSFEFLIAMKEINLTFYDQTSDNLLLMIRFIYPSLLMQSFDNKKTQNRISCFDFQIRFSKSNNKINDTFLWQNVDVDLFTIEFIETKINHQYSAIKTKINPNFMVLKWEKSFASIDLAILKPIRFKINRDICNILLNVYDLLLAKNIAKKSNKSFSKFEQINFETNQVLLQFECLNTEEGGKVRLNFSWEQMKLLGKKSFPYDLRFFDLVISTTNDTNLSQIAKILMKPTCFNCQISIIKELGQFNQQKILINMHNHIVNIAINKFHVNNLHIIQKEFYSFFMKLMPKTNFMLDSDNDNIIISQNDFFSKNFQIVLNSHQLPLPYQLLLNHDQDDLLITWCYPQQRSLIGIEVLPISKFDKDSNLKQIICKLYYWCECSLLFRYFETFYWSSENSYIVDLQSNYVLASIWQIRLEKVANNNINKDLIISCLRINSKFCQQHYNKLRSFIAIKNIEIVLNHEFIDNLSNCSFGEFKIKNLQWNYIDLISYRMRDFSVLITYSTNKVILFDIRSELFINYFDFLNYNFDEILEPMLLEFRIDYRIDKHELNLKMRSDFMKIHYSSAIYRVIKTLIAIWNNKNFKKLHFVTYIVCNNTNEVIYFGQSDTFESIEIEPKFCWCYTWKNYNKNLKMRLKLQKNSTNWSNDFNLEPKNEFCLQLEQDRLIFVKISKVSKYKLQILIMGQINIFNAFHNELIISLSQNDKKVFQGKMNSTCYFNDYKSVSIKIRHVNESQSSGVINLEKIAQKKFVKIPYQNKFKSVLCQIWLEKINEVYEKVLIMVLPLFVTRSYIPMVTKMLVLSPDCNESHEFDEICNFGESIPLYCYGSIEHRQQFFFYPMFASSSGQTFLEVKYSHFDFKKYSKQSKYVSLSEVLDEYEKSMTHKWFSDKYLQNLRKIHWKFSETFKPICQFKLSNLSKYNCILLIEYTPCWAIFNACPFNIQICDENYTQVANVSYKEVIFPSKIEIVFQIGIEDNNETNYSNLLKFNKNVKEKSFYGSETKTELLPYDGMIFMPIFGKYFVYTMLLNTFVDVGTQVLYFTSNYILHNQTKLNLNIAGVILEKNFRISLHNLQFDVINDAVINLAPSENNIGTSLIKWAKLTEIDLSNCCFYVLIKIDGEQWTNCPVLIDLNEQKKHSISLRINENDHIPICVTFELFNYQYYISINYDCPQFLIENRTNTTLICEQYHQSDCKNFQWHCIIHKKSYNFYTIPTLHKDFPRIPSNYTNNFKLILKTEKEPKMSSEPFSCNELSELYLNLPPIGEIKVAILRSEKSLIKMVIEEVKYGTIHVKTIYGNLIKNDNRIETQDDDYQTQIDGDFFQKNKNDKIDSNNFQIIRFNEHKKQTLKFSCVIFIENFQFVLNLERNFRKKAFSTLTLENFLVNFNESNTFNIHIQELQIDNNLYHTDSFDFPVVFRPVIEQNDFESNAFFSCQLTLSKKRIWNSNNFLTEIETNIQMKQFSIFIEEKFYAKIMQLSSIFNISNILYQKGNIEENNELNEIPQEILKQNRILLSPLIIRKLTVDKLELYVSLHTSVQIYIAIDQTLLKFEKFTCQSIFIAPNFIGRNLSECYTYNSIYNAPSIAGSLELTGNLTGLARNIKSGLRDFVQMPYNGLRNGPLDFLIGLSDGSQSLLTHVSVGTIRSITNLAESVARNLDIMSLDAEHIESSDEQRCDRPENLLQGFSLGLTDFALHLLGAVVGVAHHPLMSVFDNGLDVVEIVKGVGLGVVGIITKPLSGAAKLISLTGQGLLSSTGWNMKSALKSTDFQTRLEAGRSTKIDRQNAIMFYLYDENKIHDRILSSQFAENMIGEQVLLIITESYFIIYNVVKNNNIQFYHSRSIELIQLNDMMLRIIYNDPNTTVDYRQLRVSKYVQSTNSNLINESNCLSFRGDFNENDSFIRLLYMFVKHKEEQYFEIVFKDFNDDNKEQHNLTLENDSNSTNFE